MSRYHYPNPANIADNWQDLYRLDLSNGGVIASTRLSDGAVLPPRYDTTAPAVSPDGEHVLALSGGPTSQGLSLVAMRIDDTDLDNQGDDLLDLGLADLAPEAIDWGAGRILLLTAEAGLNSGQVLMAVITPDAASSSDASALDRGPRLPVGAEAHP